MSKKAGKKGEEATPVVIVPEATKASAPEGAVLVNVMDDLSKKQAFKKFSWRGKDINQLLGMKMPEFAYIL
jgi:hypothetical protein